MRYSICSVFSPGIQRFVGTALFLSSWLISSAAPPGNDSIREPQTLGGPSGQISGTTLGASVQVGEENMVPYVQGQSVWYRWPCYARGNLKLTLSGHPPGTKVSAFSTARSSWGFSDLTPIRNATPAAPAESISFEVDPSNMYLIAVASDSSATGDFVLNWNETVAANSSIDLTIAAESLVVAVQTRDFNGLACELDEGCIKTGRRRILSLDFEVLNIGKEDVLFGNPYNSPYSVFGYCEEWRRLIGFFQIRVFNSQQQLVATTDPLISCFAGTRKVDPTAADSRKFNCLKQGLRAGWAQFVNSYPPCQFADITDLPAGNYTAEVVVDPHGWISELNESNNAARIPFVVTPPCTETPSNDRREDAIAIEAGVATVIGNNECATRELNENRHLVGSPASRSIWYKWTAPSSGPVVLSTEGSSFDTIIDVQGPATDGLNGPVIATGDDIHPLNQQSRATFDAVAGKTYWIAIDGYNRGDGAQSGLVVLSLNPSGNDAFKAAEALRGTGGNISGLNAQATKESGEPAHAGNAGGHSVWFSWTAGAKGKLTLDTTGSQFPVLLDCYTGDALATLTSVANNRSTGGGLVSQTTVSVAAGQTYRIALDGENGASGMFKLGWRFEAAVVNEVPQGPKLAVALRKNKTVRLTITGKKGTLMNVERSTDLIHWTSLGRFKLNLEADTFSDMQAPQLPQSFYRVSVVQ